MKRLAVPGAILAVLLACDGGGPGKADRNDPLDTAVPQDSAEPPEIETNPMGTQVGSEGFWDCPIEDATVVAATARIQPMGDLTPTEIALAHVGEWPLELADDGSSGGATGTLTFTDAAQYLWVTVEDAPGCTDHLAIGLTGTIGRLVATPDPIAGWLAVRPGDGLLVLTAEADLASLETTWGPPTTAPLGTLQFRVEGRIDQSRFDGTVSWADCVDGSCAATEVLATVSGAR